MYKKEFISKVAEMLRVNDVRKPVPIKKHVFNITDDEGNVASFSVKKQDKEVLYTVSDVTNIVDACMSVILDTLKRGDEVNIKGFGCLRLKYRKARKTKDPNTGEWCDVAARYTPKLYIGNDMRIAAKLYELSLPPDAVGQIDNMSDVDEDFGGDE